MTEIRAVLFDMDGLMFDTERLATEAWLKVGSRNGLPITGKLLAEMRGRPLEDCIQMFKDRLGADFEFYELRRERQMYTEADLVQSGLPVKPGLKELLEYLQKSGCKIALATSTQKELASSYLKMAGVEGYFHCTVFGDMVHRGKPDPEIYQLAAQLLGVPAENCLVLEDSPVGVCAGWRAGCQVIMVPDLTEPTPVERRRVLACVKTLFDVILIMRGENPCLV